MSTAISILSSDLSRIMPKLMHTFGKGEVAILNYASGLEDISIDGLHLIETETDAIVFALLNDSTECFPIGKPVVVTLFDWCTDLVPLFESMTLPEGFSIGLAYPTCEVRPKEHQSFSTWIKKTALWKKRKTLYTSRACLWTTSHSFEPDFLQTQEWDEMKARKLEKFGISDIDFNGRTPGDTVPLVSRLRTNSGEEIATFVSFKFVDGSGIYCPFISVSENPEIRSFFNPYKLAHAEMAKYGFEQGLSVVDFGMYTPIKSGLNAAIVLHKGLVKI